jgi:hypothetical protein
MEELKVLRSVLVLAAAVSLSGCGLFAKRAMEGVASNVRLVQAEATTALPDGAIVATGPDGQRTPWANEFPTDPVCDGSHQVLFRNNPGQLGEFTLSCSDRPEVVLYDSVRPGR